MKKIGDGSLQISSIPPFLELSLLGLLHFFHAVTSSNGVYSSSSQNHTLGLVCQHCYAHMRFHNDLCFLEYDTSFCNVKDSCLNWIIHERSMSKTILMVLCLSDRL